ncbi:MAG: hypothetical protein CM15mP92_0190 [Halieaceae bacterium]|nr:MAG: hypothetical protein CM15mP92_0190 [Halieaceae bacterium]
MMAMIQIMSHQKMKWYILFPKGWKCPIMLSTSINHACQEGSQIQFSVTVETDDNPNFQWQIFNNFKLERSY